jgi:AmmeMemoRadiSam system protein A
MSPLADREKQQLLELARRALIAGVEKRESIQDFPDDKILRQPRGAFVTLHRRGRLRGCVGQLPSNDPLVEVVAHCAKAAALEDPRFKPVPAEELAEIEIELSILSPLDDVTLEKIEPGKHGLVVSRGWRRGVLLPQVATEFDWQAERFLEETCVKAGLEREAWKDPHTKVQAFTAEVFGEPALQPRVKHWR